MNSLKSIKRIMVHNYYQILNNNNNMFSGIGNATIKSFLEQMDALSKYGKEHLLDFKSSSVFSIDESDAILFIDYPKVNDKILDVAIKSKKPIFLLVWESGIVNERNIDISRHKIFERVFTYDDKVLSERRYIKIPYTFNLPSLIPKSTENKKMCCMVAGNKYSLHPLELYSKRLEVVNWFEANNVEDFSLYGRGWSKKIPPTNILDKIYNRSRFLHHFFPSVYKSYKGEVADKFLVLTQYKFSFCFENAKDITGYISEKIFDSFFAGCVPIYLGAPNIGDYIPENTFIDKREFNNYKDLFNYIATMGENEYEEYVSNIKEYLNSDSALLFSAERFTENILYHMLPR